MSKGFFEERQVSAEKSEEKWKRKEHAAMLDEWFSGATYRGLARTYRRSTKSIQRQINRLEYNEKGWAERYEPLHRADRQGQPLSPNEKNLLRTHREKGVSLDVSLKILCRESLPKKKKNYTDKNASAAKQEAEVFDARVEARRSLHGMLEVSPLTDIVVAHQYLYYVKHSPIISDKAYDELEKEMREFDHPTALVLERPGSDNEADYPAHIRALAIYLALKYGKRATS